MSERPPNILVLRGGAIGDFVMTLPAIQALRERWPGAQIELCGYPHIAEMALAAGLVNKVSSLNRSDMVQFYIPDVELPLELQCWITGFDIVISYLYDPTEVVTSNLKKAGTGIVSYGSPMVETEHAIPTLMKPLEELAIYYEPHQLPKLRFGREHPWLADQKLARPVAIHPGSGSPEKNWPTEYFIHLARKIKRGATADPFFIIGEADGEIHSELSQKASEIPLLTDQTLTQVAATLEHCAAFIGNDSGITHLAAASGTSTTALFGPSDANLWAPAGQNVVVIQAPEGQLDRLPVDDVFSQMNPISP